MKRRYISFTGINIDFKSYGFPDEWKLDLINCSVYTEDRKFYCDNRLFKPSKRDYLDTNREHAIKSGNELVWLKKINDPEYRFKRFLKYLRDEI